MAWHRQAPNGSNNESSPILGCYPARITKPDKTSRDLGERNLILTDTSLRSNSSAWVFDASNLSFLREDHFDNPMQCVSLRLNSGLGVDLKRAPAVGVSHQLLYDLHVFPINPLAGWRSCAETCASLCAF